MICKNCGKHFVSNNRDKKYCSVECYKKAQSEGVIAPRNNGSRHSLTDFTTAIYSSKAFRAMKRRERLEAEERKARLAARDAAYAEAFPHLATGGTRGRIVGGSHAGTFGDAQNDAMRVFS